MELEPVVMGPPAYGSPDPETANQTLLPLVDNSMVTAEEGTTSEDYAAGAEAGAGAEITENYDEHSKEELQAEADRRGLEIEGSGKEGNVLKDDLIEALEDDDEEKAAS